MGPREEDNGVLLLGAVAMVCGLIAFVPWLLEPVPAAASNAPAQTIRDEGLKRDAAGQVRVIVPFTPNIIPSER